MSPNFDPIPDNLAAIRDRIERAATRSGRTASDVAVVGVTKTFGADMVDAVVRAGITDIGENRIQEFLDKRDDVTESCRWHLIR